MNTGERGGRIYFVTERLRIGEQESRLRGELVWDYLHCGSVEAMSDRHPFSPAQIHRILDEYGVIKSVGRNKSSLGLALYFFTRLVQTKLPLETLYHSYMTGRFRERISKSTLHRILYRIKQGLIHSYGTALVITPAGEPDLVLVGNDMTIPDSRIQKQQGALSTPMCYAQWGEQIEETVARVLQQEVLGRTVVNREFEDIFNRLSYQKITTLKIADVEADVWHLELPRIFIDRLSSPKLQNLRFVEVGELARQKPVNFLVRPGVVEMAAAYLSYVNYEGRQNFTWDCSLNEQLALLGSRG